MPEEVTIPEQLCDLLFDQLESTQRLWQFVETTGLSESQREQLARLVPHDTPHLVLDTGAWLVIVREAQQAVTALRQALERCRAADEAADVRFEGLLDELASMKGNPRLVERMREAGQRVVGRDENGELVEHLPE